MNSATKQETPFVSLVIPVYADPGGLEITLESAVNQQYNSYEVIVSLTPSSGETLTVAEEYASKHPGLVQIVEVNERGRARARNAGIDKASGDIIAFIDADIQMKPHWLESATSDMKTMEADYLACNVCSSSTMDDVGFVEKYDQALSIPVRHYVENYHFAPTAALLLTRELIEDVGVFDPELTSGEDREFGNRVHEEGYNLDVSDSEVYHPPRKRVSEQIQKAIRIGIGMEQLRHRYPGRYSFPGLLSPLSYAPPSPRRLKSRMSANNYEPNYLMRFAFYLFNYGLKMYQQFGRWKYYRRR